MRYWNIIFLSAFFCSSLAQTVVVDRLVLKDESVLEGYISSQTGSVLKVKSSKTDIYVDAKDIELSESFDNNCVDIEEIKSAAQKSLISQLINRSNLQIIEAGDKYLLRSTNLNEFIIDLIKDVKRVERVNVDKQIDIIESKQGNLIRGHIMFTIPGELMQLKDESGKIINLYYSNIVSEKKELKDIENDLAEIPYLDKIITKDKESIVGVLIEKNFKDSYIKIKARDSNSLRRINNSDISKICKEPNKNARKNKSISSSPYIEVNVKSAEKSKERFRINDEELQLIEVSTLSNKRSNKECYVVELPADQSEMFMVFCDEKGERIANVSLPFGFSSEDICLIKPNYGIIKVKDGKNFEEISSLTKEVNAFWFNDKMLKPGYGEMPDISEDGKVLSFNLNLCSVYILYNKKDKNCILIKTN